MKLHALLSLSLLLITIFSCKPVQEPTEFNALIEVPIGADMNLSVARNGNLDIDYFVQSSDESIDLEILISKNPQNGSLSNCEKLVKNAFRCIYTPRKDFVGKDQIQIKTKDGDIFSSRYSTIYINVTYEGINPTVTDGSTSGLTNELISLDIPEGSDLDGAASDLTYKIVSEPLHGKLVDCFGAKGVRNCYFQADGAFEGVDSFEYIVTDKDGLDSNKGTFTINISLPELLSGSETFFVEDQKSDFVEIIWVVDNSLSMEDEQEALKNNFDSFINSFIKEGYALFDFNMGVITTDTYSKSQPGSAFRRDNMGKIFNLSSERIVNGDLDGFKADFKKAVSVGTSGSGAEKALESIKISKEFEPNFFKDSTDKLSVFIILTDEKEQSHDISIFDYFSGFYPFNLIFDEASFLKDHSDQLKSWKNLFDSWGSAETKIYSIYEPYEDSGKRYGELSNMYGTSKYNIKDPFNDILSDISTDVSSYVGGYKLNRDRVVIPSSVKVFLLDGESEVELTDGWIFQNGGIKFINNPTNSIKVTYNYYLKN